MKMSQVPVERLGNPVPTNRTPEQVGSSLGKPFSESNTAPDARGPCATFSSMLTAFSVTQDVARRLVSSAEALGEKAKGKRQKAKGKEQRAKSKGRRARGEEQEAKRVRGGGQI